MGYEQHQGTVRPESSTASRSDFALIRTSCTWILFPCFTRCWDIIENTDVFWWIIKTPILASILVSLHTVSFFSSLKFHHINIYSLWAVDTLQSNFSRVKLIATERENVFVSYHQPTSDLSVSVIYVKAFELFLVFLLYVNTTERLVRPQSSHFTLESFQEYHHRFVVPDWHHRLHFHSIFTEVVLASTETSVDRCK